MNTYAVNPVENKISGSDISAVKFALCNVHNCTPANLKDKMDDLVNKDMISRVMALHDEDGSFVQFTAFQLFGDRNRNMEHAKLLTLSLNAYESLVEKTAPNKQEKDDISALFTYLILVGTEENFDRDEFFAELKLTKPNFDQANFNYQEFLKQFVDQDYIDKKNQS